MPKLIDAQALHVDGRTLDYREFLGPMVPQFGIHEAVIKLDQGAVRVRLDPSRGEAVRAFTRRSMSLGANGAPTGEIDGVVVIEIAPDPDKPDRFVRLYIGREVVISTLDQNG